MTVIRAPCCKHIHIPVIRFKKAPLFSVHIFHSYILKDHTLQNGQTHKHKLTLIWQLITKLGTKSLPYLRIHVT